MLYIECGKIVSKFIGDKEIENNLLYGALLLIGSNQIILTPCILLHTSFKIAFYLTSIINIFLVVISFFVKEKSSFKIKKESIPILSIIIILIII